MLDIEMERVDGVVAEDPRKPHLVEGGSAELPDHLRKALSDSIQADMADPARSVGCAWLWDRDAPRTGT